MNRLEATRVIVQLAGDSPIVASLGHPAYDLFTAGDRLLAWAWARSWVVASPAWFESGHARH
jgi:hypothetical protein